jgi:hypothetical protein
VPTAREFCGQGDRREGVARIAEGGEQDATSALPPAQSISASSRTMRRRASGSKAIGEAISVPTPASS